MVRSHSERTIPTGRGAMTLATVNVDYRLARTAAPVREQAVQQLRKLVLNGYFQPGQRIIEHVVCELLDTSRTTVREALRQLEAEGLVEIQPGKGPSVVVVTERDVRDLYELREVLETFALSLFAERASEADMAALEQAFVGLEEAQAQGAASAVLEAKQLFYDVLFAGAGNAEIESVAQRIHWRVARIRLKSLGQPGRIERGIEELRTVIGLLKAGKSKAALEAYAVHMERARAAAIEVFRSQAATTITAI